MLKSVKKYNFTCPLKRFRQLYHDDVELGKGDLCDKSY